MISKNLVSQVEAHTDQLVREVVSTVAKDERARSYQALPEHELREAVDGLLRNMGIWLTSRSDDAIEMRYRKIGIQRRHGGIPLSEMIRAFGIVKTTLVAFVRHQVVGDPAERLMEPEFILAISEFIDKAVYAAALGYESAEGTAPAAKATAMPFVPATTAVKKEDVEWDPTSRAGEVGEVSG